MHFRHTFLLPAFSSVVLLSLLAQPAPGGGGERCRQDWLATLAHASIGEDAESARDAIAQLRDAGQDGLDALCDQYAALAPGFREIPAHVESGTLQHTLVDDPRIARLRSAIDAVAKQRDAHASRLFWFTDFEEAMAQAAASGKPILSLRLLGKLDEDLSCANSRFFRSVLYANAQVSDYLREHYILHWESLRPVPKMTIDFGDGRRIERTITGNSIHYVLDSNGAIIDALPGLYGPAPFLRHLKAAETVLRQSSMMPDPRESEELLRHWHAAAVVRIDTQLRDDMRTANATPVSDIGPADAAAKGGNLLLAVPAAVVAPTKMRAEVKAVEAAINAPGAIVVAASANDDALWERIAMLHADDAALDQASVALIEAKLPTEMAEAAHRVTMTKRMEETPAMRMLRNLQQSLAIDSVRNEYQLHRTIHEWLAQPRSDSDQPLEMKSFNQRVYAELFLTPLDDPWMGLVPRDAYAAIDGGGLLNICK